jgi:hypothetical protein
MRATRWTILTILISTMAVAGAAGCAGAPPPVTVPLPGVAGAAPHEAPAPVAKKDSAPEERPAREQPGLGTEWGETRSSQIAMVSFERESARRPAATESLRYDDEEGARAIAGGAFAASFEMWDVARSMVKIGLRDETGRLFPGFAAGDREVIVGEAGHRYTILLHNNTDRRLEVVLSVDGLDVLDGQPAALDKRGYVVDARGDLEVFGFRQSADAVAAFRFGSVRGSYAGLKHGNTRGVGTIGVAVFDEKGSLPFPWTAEEVRRRREANPFPGEGPTSTDI